jgi:hypothetical protein
MQKEKLSRNIYLSIIITLFFSLLVAGAAFGLNTASFEEGFSFGQKYRSEKKRGTSMILCYSLNFSHLADKSIKS